ncbi:MAG: PH domain-containing protein [Acidobacteria bacterium]|nr:PH domain-containing protein [Acidobacteriota bacterium]
MRCPACGQENPAESRFCNRCGSDLVPTLATSAQAGPVAPVEEILFVIRPAFFFVGLRYLIAVLTASAAAWAYATWIDRYPDAELPWWGMLGITSLLFLPAVIAHVQRSREVYTLTNHKIEFTYGILSKIRRNIPLNKVQDVTVTRSFGERLLGLGDILIDSAAVTGKIPLRNIREPEMHADVILRQIQRNQA